LHSTSFEFPKGKISNDDESSKNSDGELEDIHYDGS